MPTPRPKGPTATDGDYGKEYLLTHDAGSGPYKVKEFPLEEYLLMEKNADWWGEFNANAPDELKMHRHHRGRHHPHHDVATRSWRSPTSGRRWRRSRRSTQIEGVKVAAYPNQTSFYYMIHNKKAPTDDVHCRRAMAYAFDYDAAVSLEWPGTEPMVGPVMRRSVGTTRTSPSSPRDLDKAKEELAQCKYADELDKYPVEFVWISEVPDEEKYALLFQANMAEIGIPVEIVSTPWMSVVESTAEAGDQPAHRQHLRLGGPARGGPMLKQRYHSSSAPTWSQNEWLLDKELDATIDDALATVDEEERFEKYEEIQDYARRPGAVHLRLRPGREARLPGRTWIGRLPRARSSR